MCCCFGGVSFLGSVNCHLGLGGPFFTICPTWTILLEDVSEDWSVCVLDRPGSSGGIYMWADSSKMLSKLLKVHASVCVGKYRRANNHLHQHKKRQTLKTEL